MKKILISILVLLLLCLPVYATKIHTKATDLLGGFSGDGGSAQDDSAKASMDLAHTDLDLLIRNATSGLLGLGNGNVWYVDSGAGGTALGTSWTNASLTIDAAIVLLGAATEADTGAIILCAPGHAETLAATDQVDLDFAGIKLIGLGVGENRATMTYTTDGEIVFGADDCELHNFNLIAGNAVTNAVLVATGAENWVINNCRFAVTTLDTHEFTFGVITAADADNGKITNCRFEMGAASADAAIQNVGCDFVEISNNIFTGDYSTACIEDVTTASIWMIIDDNILVNGTGGTFGLNTVACISLKTDTTAIITDNKLFCDVTDPSLSIVADEGLLSGNTYCEGVGTSIGSEPVAGFGKVNTIIAQSSAMTSGNGYGSGDDPELFDVTGDVMVRCFAIVDTSVTSTSNDTIELGVAGDTACVLKQEDDLDGTAMVANDVWTLTQSGDTPSAEWSGAWVIIPNGLNILLTINDNHLTAGVITYYMQWIALSRDGLVVDSVD